jgi:hypothetical protein
MKEKVVKETKRGEKITKQIDRGFTIAKKWMNENKEDEENE